MNPQTNRCAVNITKELLDTNDTLLETNDKLLGSNAELLRANTKLVEANAELAEANSELRDANADLKRKASAMNAVVTPAMSSVAENLLAETLRARHRTNVSQRIRDRYDVYKIPARDRAREAAAASAGGPSNARRGGGGARGGRGRPRGDVHARRKEIIDEAESDLARDKQTLCGNCSLRGHKISRWIQLGGQRCNAGVILRLPVGRRRRHALGSGAPGCVEDVGLRV